MLSNLPVKILILSLSTALTGCSLFQLANLKEPKAELKEVYLKDMNFSGGTLMFVLDVQNPNKEEIKVDEITYETFIDGQFFSQAKTNKSIQVPGEKTIPVELPLPIEFSKLAGGVAKAIKGEPVEYRIKGNAKLSLLTIPFDKSGKLELKKQ